MDTLNRETIPQETWEILKEIKDIASHHEVREKCNRLVPLLIAYWDIHPHSAMESLEYAARVLPLSIAHSVVRQTVMAWRQKSTYDPDAGGNANHCYLSALILSENYDIAEHPWADNILNKTLRKDLDPTYGRRDMRDADAKLELVKRLHQSSSNTRL